MQLSSYSYSVAVAALRHTNCFSVLKILWCRSLSVNWHLVEKISDLKNSKIFHSLSNMMSSFDTSVTYESLLSICTIAPFMLAHCIHDRGPKPWTFMPRERLSFGYLTRIWYMPCFKHLYAEDILQCTWQNMFLQRTYIVPEKNVILYWIFWNYWIKCIGVHTCAESAYIL